MAPKVKKLHQKTNKYFPSHFKFHFFFVCRMEKPTGEEGELTGVLGRHTMFLLCEEIKEPFELAEELKNPNLKYSMTIRSADPFAIVTSLALVSEELYKKIQEETTKLSDETPGQTVPIVKKLFEGVIQ